MKGLAFLEGEWRRYRDSAAPNDLEAYSDILECCRRQGFLDVLGDDLLASSFDNGDYPVVIGERLDEGGRPTVATISAHRLHGPRRQRFQRQAEEAQRQWEAANRERQRRREERAEREWQAEEARRRDLAWLVEHVVVPKAPEEAKWLAGLKVEQECHQLIYRAWLVFKGEIAA